MKFPSYIQLDGMDCGAACLQIISKYYGRYFSQQTMRELCHITRNGVSLRGISDAAETIGYRTIGTKLTWEQLQNDAMKRELKAFGKRESICPSIKKEFATILENVLKEEERKS